MMTRRTFSSLLAGAVAAPEAALAQGAAGKLACYSGAGSEFTHYEIDVGALTLTKRASVQLPALSVVLISTSSL